MSILRVRFAAHVFDRTLARVLPFVPEPPTTKEAHPDLTAAQNAEAAARHPLCGPGGPSGGVDQGARSPSSSSPRVLAGAAPMVPTLAPPSVGTAPLSPALRREDALHDVRRGDALSDEERDV